MSAAHCGDFFAQGISRMICPCLGTNFPANKKIFHVKDRIIALTGWLLPTWSCDAVNQNRPIACSRSSQGLLRQPIQSDRIAGIDRDAGQSR